MGNPELQKELDEYKTKLQAKISSVTKVMTWSQEYVKVEISITKFRTLTMTLRFPQSYPETNLLVELTSKTLGHNLLFGLSAQCEDECKKCVGEPQIMRVVQKVSKFLEEKPLCCCAEEISNIKRDILKSEDAMVLKQKQSSVNLIARQGKYYYDAIFCVPDDYPQDQIRIELNETNFSSAFQKYFQAQMTEIARRCVEPPLNKKKAAQTFEKQPSLFPVVKFLVESVHRYVDEICCGCNNRAFPGDPANVFNESSSKYHVERLYCGHVFHLKCLVKYMKTPPFQGGKKCPSCEERIFHEKYKVPPELEEARWAHKQARQREFTEKSSDTLLQTFLMGYSIPLHIARIHSLQCIPNEEDLCCPVCRNPLSTPGSPLKNKVHKQKLTNGKGFAPHQQNTIKAYRNTRIAVGKFKDNEEISLAQCGHLFHKFCLRHYCFLFRQDRPNNSSKVSCPQCQASISMISSHLIDYKVHQGKPTEFDREFTKTEVMHEELSGQKDTVGKKLTRVSDSIENGYHNLDIYRSHRHKLKQELRQTKSLRHEIEGLYGKIQYADRMLGCMQTQHLKIVRKFINAAKQKAPENFVHLPRRLFPFLSYIEEDDRLVRNLGEILVPIQVNNLKSDRRSLLKEILAVVSEKLATEKQEAEADATQEQLVDTQRRQANQFGSNEHPTSPVVVKVQNSSVSIISSASLTKASIQKILATVEGPIRALKKAHKSAKQKKVKLIQKLSNNVVDNVSASDIKIIYMPKRKMIQQLSEPCRNIEESECSLATVPVRKCISTDAVLMKTRKKKAKADGKPKSKRKLKLTNKRSNSITVISTDKEQVVGKEYNSGDQVTLNFVSGQTNPPLPEVAINKIKRHAEEHRQEAQPLDFTNLEYEDPTDIVDSSELPKATSVLEIIYDNLEEDRKSNHHIFEANQRRGVQHPTDLDENQNEICENSGELVVNSLYEDTTWQQKPMFYRVDKKGVLRAESPSCVVFREPTFLCNSARDSRINNSVVVYDDQPDEENQLDAMSPEERYLIATEQESIFSKNSMSSGGTKPMFHGIPACLGMPDTQNMLRAQSDLRHTPFYLKRWQKHLPSNKVLNDAQRRIPMQKPLQTARTIQNPKRSSRPPLPNPALSSRPQEIFQPMFRSPSIHLPPLSMFPAKRPSTAECNNIEDGHQEGPESLKRFYNGAFE
ncbi:E3 ubiquitin-protein ligase TRAIP [Orchesella cincta]|uniref:E3 ubiquitin-protein ligase TRAIP n=1 Tax=Orchesella cincta TaxID=48709 RepID=A0A1D2MEQ7_ORCCI|nr:E3 ubiquitin-protein ligase TRAIP [Orchesella cincta]